MRQLTKDINSLKETDILNILLYGLYKLKDVPEYSAISELSYVLDKDSLYKLCSVYGGTTIRIPELSELKTITMALLMCKLIADGYSTDDALVEAGVNVSNKKEVLKMYDILIGIINDYEK